MKTFWIQLVTVSATFAVCANDVQAQPPARVSSVPPLHNVQSQHSHAYPQSYYGLPRLGHHGHYASTVAGSYARGIAEMTDAAGRYNRLTAEARAIHAEAQLREIENHETYVRTYFAVKRINRQAVASMRSPRLSSAEIARRAKEALPDRLSPGQLDGLTGEVSWPVLLQADEFAALRAELEKAFAERAASRRLEVAKQTAARQTTDAMLGQLKRFVHDVHPNDYTEAKRFIRSLAYEVRLSVI